MDAAAYLKKNGWRGAGHSLDHTGRGIVKPLLISHKTDALGIGKKKTQVADQWWMRAFDESLKELGSGKQTTLSQIRENGVTRGGLYGFFVRGEGLQGTITEEETTSTGASSTESSSTKATSVGSTTSDSDSTQTDESNSEDNTSSTDTSSEDSSSTASDSESSMASEPSSAAEADFIPLPAPEAGKKRKREKESAAAIRKRRKGERAEKAKANSSTVEQAEPVGNGIHADRMKMINKSGYMLNDGTQPGPVVVGRGKLSYKAQKYERERAKRIAKRAEKARLQGLMDPDSAPSGPQPAPADSEKLKPDASEQIKREEKEKAKVEKRERNAAKKAKLEEKERKKAERRQQTKERRALKIAHRQETARKHKELKAEKEAAERAEREAQSKTDDFAGAADEIKLGPDSKGRVKTIPGIGRVDRYPTKAEKRQKKIESRALEAGISVEDYLAQEAAKKAAQGGPTAKESKRKQRAEEAQREAAAAVDGADVAKDPTPAISVPAEPLSDKKKEKYAARAAEKGITVEEYISRRAAKKAGKAGKEDGVSLTSAAEAPQQSGSFVVDMTGDAALAPAGDAPAFIIDTAGDPTIVESKQREATAKGPLVWDPSMLGDRKVKDLSKEERKARLEYMRARRAAKKATAGAHGASLSKKEKAKRRAERKQGLQAKLVAEIVAQKGKSREEVTKEEVKMAQRQAKRTLKELKREKRNKVIHRGKKGFGETTKRLSMGGRNK